MTDQEFETVENMTKYGGSFVKALAECFRHADPNNFQILKSVFSEYWAQYENWNKHTQHDS